MTTENTMMVALRKLSNMKGGNVCMQTFYRGSVVVAQCPYDMDDPLPYLASLRREAMNDGVIEVLS